MLPLHLLRNDLSLTSWHLKSLAPLQMFNTALQNCGSKHGSLAHETTQYNGGGKIAFNIQRISTAFMMSGSNLRHTPQDREHVGVFTGSPDMWHCAACQVSLRKHAVGADSSACCCDCRVGSSSTSWEACRLPSVRAVTDSSLPLIWDYYDSWGGKREFPACCLLFPCLSICVYRRGVPPQP